MAAKKKVIKKAVLSLPSASDAVERQKALWEKYHGGQADSASSISKPVRVHKVKSLVKTAKIGTSKKRRRSGTDILRSGTDILIESKNQAINARNGTLDATRGTHIYKDQKWFGGLSSYDNYSDEAHSKG